MREGIHICFLLKVEFTYACGHDSGGRWLALLGVLLSKVHANMLVHFTSLSPKCSQVSKCKMNLLYPQLNPCIFVFKWVAYSQTITTIKLQQMTYFNEPNVHKKFCPLPHLLVGSLIACILDQACILLVFF